MSKGTINKAFILGRLGKDPEMRYAPSGTAIATFSVATNSSQKQDDEWIDKTDWHNILAFGKNAEFAGEYLKKGQQVFVEGRLQTSSWEDQQGQKKYRTEIVVSEIQMIGTRNDNSTGSDQNEETKASKVEEKPPTPATEEEDDLPF